MMKDGDKPVGFAELYLICCNCGSRELPCGCEGTYVSPIKVTDKKPVGVKRYDVVVDESRDRVRVERPNGDFVTFEDYDRMMRIAREALRKIARNTVPGGHDQNMAREALAALGEE